MVVTSVTNATPGMKILKRKIDYKKTIMTNVLGSGRAIHKLVMQLK